MMMEWATVLDVVWSITKACRAGIKLAVDSDMSQTMTMEACFVIVRMIRG